MVIISFRTMPQQERPGLAIKVTGHALSRILRPPHNEVKGKHKRCEWPHTGVREQSRGAPCLVENRLVGTR